MSVHILTVSTHVTVGYTNWLYTLKQLGYTNIHTLGFGLKWGGWRWRTKIYHQGLSALPDEDDAIYVLCDSSDLFFLQGPEVLRQKFTTFDTDLLISGEGNKSVFSIDPELYDTIFTGVFRNPNAGCIIGSKSALLSYLEKNDAENDQEGLTRMFVEGNLSKRAKIDTNGEITATIPKINEQYTFDELSKFSFIDGKMTCNVTGTEPVIAHFPGKVVHDYNTVLSEIYPELENRHWTETASYVISTPIFWIILVVIIILVIWYIQRRRS
jgi:hypothetical protein